jgi:hypothetical protein
MPREIPAKFRTQLFAARRENLVSPARHRPQESTMDLNTAKQMVGQVVQDSMGSDIFGVLECITPDGWAGIRGPFNRYDELPLSRIEIDPT